MKQCKDKAAGGLLAGSIRNEHEKSERRSAGNGRRQHGNVKKAEIKIRVTEQDKEKLMQSAYSHNENLSSYMLRKALCDDQDLMQSLPQQIDACNFFNEIYHAVSRYGSRQLKTEIMELYQKYTSVKEGGIRE